MYRGRPQLNIYPGDSPKMWQVAVDKLAKMRELGVIEKSWSEGSSAPVIVTKQDKTCRFCVDYRALNQVTKKYACPSQNVDSILDKLRGILLRLT